ncbi:MAG: hypothetical protein D6776_12185, partial [Planctomycetota bacterium]
PDWRRQQALAKAALGERVLVHLALRLERRLDYLVVEDRLPAGLEPEREGARGPFDRYEARPGGGRFFLAHLEPGTHVLHYVARAVTPGRFRALPARAWGMYEPGVHARSAGARFSVLEGQAPARVETPDEIAARARKAAEHRRWREVREAVGRLLPLALRAPVRTEMLALEVRAALELGETKAAIAAYEALDDLDPGAARTLRRERSVGMGLGAAYLETGAFALARELLLEQVLAQFETDLEVAQVYRKLGRELPAQRYLLGLVRRYPDREAVIATWYRTARRYYDLERPSDDRGPRHFRPPVRERMVEEAYEALREFIAFFPESSWCDDAQRTAARAMEAIEQWALAAQEYDRLVRRYPDSPHVDDALWGAVRARYEAGQYDAALEAGRRLLAWRRKGKSGAVQRSRHRDEVRLLFARIYHSRGAIAKAVEYYRQVAKRFDDARASLAFFTEPRLELDDVVMLAPTEDTLPLRARNIDALAFEIYPVDLLLLLATHPDLGDVRGIDLTGIRPERRFEVRLGDNRYRWRTERVKLGLDRPGAFLVVCKGEQGIEASCLVVRTPLEVRTQRVDGRLRVYVVEREGRRPVAKAHVSISDGRRIRARGRTDARGVFEAPAFGTPASVVVERDGQWGLWRAGMGE